MFRGRRPTPLALMLVASAIAPFWAAAQGGSGQFVPGFAASPEWLRRAPALYIPTVRSAGAGVLEFGEKDSPMLCDRLDSFRRLPELLERARRLGTDTIYLVDYYQGWPGQPPAMYWSHKGDYIPRADLGGEAAFREGIAAVHARGGRVILYVEGFIISKRSEVGQAHGADWSIMTPAGPLEEPYPGNWKLCPACPGWVDHITSVCRRLVGDYGADGLHIDSYGYQMNWRCVSAAHGHPVGQPAVFNNGCVELVRRVRGAIQAVNPDAVIIVEGPNMRPLFQVIDGSQDWGIHTLRRTAVANAAGQTDVFTTGWSLDDLHRILALGHKLSLSDYWFESPTSASCAASLPPEPPPPFKGENERRAFSERCSRALHQWRNAGVLLGAPMPTLGDVTPRRMERLDTFRSDPLTLELMDKVRERANPVDAALAAFKQGWPPERPWRLPAPADHLRALLEARVRLSPLIDDGATMAPLAAATGAAQGLDVAAYRFQSPRGEVITIVNGGNERAVLALPVATTPPKTSYRDELTGESYQARDGVLSLECASHSLTLLAAGK